MTESFHPRQNKLLAALPDVELLRLAPELDPVELHQGQALYESGTTMSYAYFPTTALVSMVYEFEDGALAETAVVGNEGMVGIAVFMGGDSRLGRAVVLRAGHAFRMRAHALKEEFQRAGPLMHLLLRYTQALITQIAQTAACNRHHSLDQRLCRWLLLSLDRMQGNDVGMTQELIANMLGVRRESVTAAAQTASEARADPLYARPHRRPRPSRPGAARLRVLRGGPEGVRAVAAPRRGSRRNAAARWHSRGTAQPLPAGVFASERTAVAQPSTFLHAEFD